MGKKAKEKEERKGLYDLLTIREAADYLRVHPDTIRNWIRSNKINYLLIDSDTKRKIYRINRKDLERLVKVG